MTPSKALVAGDFSPREIERFHASYHRGDAAACWPWRLTPNHRYGLLWLWRNNANDAERANRVAFVLAGGKIEAGQVVRHLCHNSRCVNPAHLAVGSDHDNRQDDIRAGKLPMGERCGSAKLTRHGVRLIRQMWAGGINQAVLARKFGMSWWTIHEIVKGERWPHIKGEA